MEFSLEDLVRLSGFTVDTIRYYQSLRLIPLPEHKGRKAVYQQEHLDRLDAIRKASERGLPLKVVREVFATQQAPDFDSELLAVVEKQLAKPCYTRAQMAKLLGVSEKLLRLIESRGLADPLGQGDGSLRYSEDDLRVGRDALKLLEHGFPLASLLITAMQHDRAMRKTATAAISLFNQHIRKNRRGRQAHDDAERTAEVFCELFPIVTSLVAHHFQRVLVGEALKQLKRSGQDETLRIARKSIGRAWFSIRPRTALPGA